MLFVVMHKTVLMEQNCATFTANPPLRITEALQSILDALGKFDY